MGGIPLKVIKSIAKTSFQLPQNLISLYNDINFAIFDIETTGINANFDKVILIGILFIKNNQIIIEQFFCENRNEEKELLTCFKKRIENFHLLISYNGNAFDIPFLNKRFQKNKVNYAIMIYKNLDLFKVIKKNASLFKLEDYKLKSIEKYLGFQRKDTISGKESVELYKQFEKSKNKAFIKTILLHNYDDLYYLAQSLIILDQIPYKDIVGEVPQIFYTQNYKIGYIDPPMIKKGTLFFRGLYHTNLKNNYTIHENGFSFEYTASLNTFNVKVPLYKGFLSSGIKCFYINKNDFLFDYPIQQTTNCIPNNMVIVKEKDSIKAINIQSFGIALMKYIFEKIEKNFLIQ
jgi:uncharacterized protein YprB with RNaseH-like and TPR domain